MPITQKTTIKTEAYFSKDGKHRYLLKKEWDKRKKKAMVIMINPSSADSMVIDHTTMYVINNLSKLDFGSVDIVNMFSKIDIRLSSRQSIEELVDKENDNYIEKSAAKADYIIIAWGSIGENNKKIKERQKEIFNLLKKYKDKLYTICDLKGRGGYHPLAPQVRHSWKLEKMNLEDDLKIKRKGKK
ncbi:hypothetical protein SAMN02745135_02356 [Caloranaerobacter azorensis DSM 13643]|uniref:DUF1643 domain-containing protein n=1 Tax=Caloranaerobacter azorensis DSM 13643 TaxID=1121264 RepID=A0A1M5W971_9FIRM|nr:DUF1643 domain-containing protein [Caloranaerobacter azorensis]SHH84017.1 hypothetical protein SAMN02745135_02356 [Caloranaerobacter azorensis DSM 13643]